MTEPKQGEEEIPQADVMAHVARMCQTLYNNFDLYLDQLQVIPQSRFQMIEIVLINAMARHMVGIENVGIWKNAFPSLEQFRIRHELEIAENLKQAVTALRGRL